MDESGDHNLDLSKLDNQYNVFVLSGVIFKEVDYHKFDQEFRKLKVELFGSDDFVVHTKEMVRPHLSKDLRYLKFRQVEFRNQFYNRMNDLIGSSPFSIVSCTIRKDKLIDRYGINAHNPYYIALENLVNRIMYFCNGKSESTCEIYPEKRGYPEDDKLDIEFIKLKFNGTKFYKAHDLRKHLTKFQLVDKIENHSGNQLADLAVSPIGRFVVGKPAKIKGNEIDYDILKSKFMKPDHFVIFP